MKTKLFNAIYALIDEDVVLNNRLSRLHYYAILCPTTSAISIAMVVITDLIMLFVRTADNCHMRIKHPPSQKADYQQAEIELV